MPKKIKPVSENKVNKDNLPGYDASLPRGGLFVKGGPPGPGRPPSLTDASAPTDAAILDFIARAKDFFNTNEYWENVKARILASEAAHVEAYLLPRVFGRPKETVAFEGGGLGFQIVLMGPPRDPLADPETPPQKALPPKRSPIRAGVTCGCGRTPVHSSIDSIIHPQKSDG